MSLKTIECDCKDLQCFCGLPLFMMDHLQLPCCGEAKYHVLCISNQTKCFKCNKEFDKFIKRHIQNAEAIVLQKLQKEEKFELKRLQAREQLQRLINSTIFVKYFT